MEGFGGSYLTLMSALYFLPLTMPSRVGVWLSLKLRVTSYTAVTVRQNKKKITNKKTRIEQGEDYVCVCGPNLCLSDTAVWW